MNGEKMGKVAHDEMTMREREEEEERKENAAGGSCIYK